MRGEKKKKQRETLSSGVEIMGGTDLSAYYKQRLKSFAGKICQEDGREKHAQHQVSEQSDQLSKSVDTLMSEVQITSRAR